MCAVASETKVQNVELKVQPCGGSERERERESESEIVLHTEDVLQRNQHLHPPPLLTITLRLISPALPLLSSNSLTLNTLSLPFPPTNRYDAESYSLSEAVGPFGSAPPSRSIRTVVGAPLMIRAISTSSELCRFGLYGPSGIG